MDDLKPSRESLEAALQEARVGAEAAYARLVVARSIIAPVDALLRNARALAWRARYGEWPPEVTRGSMPAPDENDAPTFPTSASFAIFSDTYKQMWAEEYRELRRLTDDHNEMLRRIQAAEARLDNFNKVPLSRARRAPKKK